MKKLPRFPAKRCRVRSKSTVLCVALFVATSATHAVAQNAAPPSADALHVLNRLAFGPRAAEMAAVNAMGTRAWIEQQLQPEKMDDSAVEAKLRPLQMLRLSAPQLLLAYESDKALLKARNAAKARQDIAAKFQKMAKDARQNGFQLGMTAQSVGEMATAKLVRAVESPRQLQEVLADFWTNHFNLDVNKQAVSTLRIADERDAIRPFIFGKFRDLLGASAHSPAMLIYLDNARSTREIKMAPRAVMADKNEGAMMEQDAPPMQRKRGGVNENYARELMELHTLGVSGGYTQQDVQDVARCFTGWSVDPEGEFVFRRNAHDDGEKLVLGQRIAAGGGRSDGERVLDILAAHPSTAKFIARKLTVRFVNDSPPAALVDRAAQTFLKTGGDLREVTRTIVLSPEFFESANRRVKIKSPFEFAVSAVRALDGAVSVPDPFQENGRAQLLRDGGVSLYRARKYKGNISLASELALMGQPLFAFSAPTGYAENSQSWVSAGGLVARLNFALDLSSDSVNNALVDRAKLYDRVDLNDANAIIDRLNERVLGGTMSASTRATLQKQAGATPDASKLLALTLGSPEFQRR